MIRLSKKYPESGNSETGIADGEGVVITPGLSLYSLNYPDHLLRRLRPHDPDEHGRSHRHKHCPEYFFYRVRISFLNIVFTGDPDLRGRACVPARVKKRFSLF